jgi:CRISPR-associated protein Csy2
MTAKPAAWLLLPHLRVQNANAISGPFSWGFPAPSAFTGFVHALSRKLPGAFVTPVLLDGVGIVCHRFEPQVGDGFVKGFSLSRNPVDHTGSPTAFVEEGRVHLEVSLLIGVRGEAVELATTNQLADMAQRLSEIAQSQRLAGGSLLPSINQSKPSLTHTDRPERELRFLRRQLLPGFALIERSDRLEQHLQALQQDTPDATPLDALMDACALHWDCEASECEDSTRADWHVRSRPGWLVPMPVGYRAISPLYEPGTVRNARDNDTPFRFVESLYSLGEWISPHRVDDLQDLLWHHDAEPEQGLYRCTNSYASTQRTFEQGE